MRSEVELGVGTLGLMVPEEGPVLQAKGPAQSQRKPSQGPRPGGGSRGS